MSLKPVVDKLEDVDEAFRGEYKEHTDTKTNTKFFALDIEGPIDPHPAVKGLKDEAARRRINETQLSSKLAAYKPLEAFGDTAAIIAKLDKYPELEAAAEGKLDEKKLGELVETRVKSKLAPIERERDQFKAQVAEKDGVISTMTAKEKTRTVLGVVTKAARDAKVVDTALEDVEMYGDRLFEVQEDGSVVTKDGVGVTPGLTPKQWLEDIAAQGRRPHWFGTSQGGGAGGNRGGGAGGFANNPWSHEHWNMTAQGNYLRANGADKAAKAAAAAGTTVGGQKPAKKAA